MSPLVVLLAAALASCSAPHTPQPAAPTAAAPPSRSSVRYPADTRLPIRFLEHMRSGHARAGTPVLVQTMGALVAGPCVIVPAFTQVMGTVAESRGPRRFGGAGTLGLRFDSLQLGSLVWVPLEAVLDSLEYTVGVRIVESGEIVGVRTWRHVLLHAGVPDAAVAATGVGVVPAALLAGARLAGHGPSAGVFAGELAVLRLLASLEVPAPTMCDSIHRHEELARAPALPRFAARTASRAGRPADPINLVLIGTAPNVDSAFRSAGWTTTAPHRAGALTRELLAALEDRPSVRAPVSTQYFGGRPQDRAFELAGPNARIRHHLRLWVLDSVTGIWVGAASEDVGLTVNPLRGRATHRIDPDIDDERDRIVRDLEAGACADLVAYVPVWDGPQRLRNAQGQEIVTDGRAPVIRTTRCSPSDSG
jgi:hypothetical protein